MKFGSKSDKLRSPDQKEDVHSQLQVDKYYEASIDFSEH